MSDHKQESGYKGKATRMISKELCFLRTDTCVSTYIDVNMFPKTATDGGQHPFLLSIVIVRLMLMLIFQLVAYSLQTQCRDVSPVIKQKG